MGRRIMDNLVLLPSARLAPAELAAEFGAIPSGMIPLDSRPALHHIIERYLDAGSEVVVAVHENAQLICDYISGCQWETVRSVDVGPTSSLGKTVLEALERSGVLLPKLTINFADTYIGDALKDGDVVYYQDVKDRHRWTTFTVGDDGKLHDIDDKRPDAQYGSQAHAFVGLFQMSEPQRFRELLRAH